MKKIIVSACLLGRNCKYSGGNNKNLKLISLLQGKNVLPVCPEEMSNLTTPRPPAEIIGGSGEDVWSGLAKIITREGKDLTGNFLIGAKKVKDLAQETEIILAVMKERSPSCGVNQIYDGSFSGRTMSGQGVTTGLLRNLGIKVVSEENPHLEEIIQSL